MYVGERFRGKWAEALLCHGRMNFYPIPPKGSVPSPSPACSPPCQCPATETLPNPDCTIPTEKNHTSIPGLGAPLPRDPSKCLEHTCQGQWGCISKVSIPSLSGKDSLQSYAKLNKLGNYLSPWGTLLWTSPPPGCEMHPGNGQPVCQILLGMSTTLTSS